MEGSDLPSTLHQRLVGRLLKIGGRQHYSGERRVILMKSHPDTLFASLSTNHATNYHGLFRVSVFSMHRRDSCTRREVSAFETQKAMVSTLEAFSEAPPR